jgi:hypothetical protein
MACLLAVSNSIADSFVDFLPPSRYVSRDVAAEVGRVIHSLGLGPSASVEPFSDDELKAVYGDHVSGALPSAYSLRPDVC